MVSALWTRSKRQQCVAFRHKLATAEFCLVLLFYPFLLNVHQCISFSIWLSPSLCSRPSKCRDQFDPSGKTRVRGRTGPRGVAHTSGCSFCSDLPLPCYTAGCACLLEVGATTYCGMRHVPLTCWFPEYGPLWSTIFLWLKMQRVNISCTTLVAWETLLWYTWLNRISCRLPVKAQSRLYIDSKSISCFVFFTTLVWLCAPCIFARKFMFLRH